MVLKKKKSYETLMKDHFDILKSLQYESGLFAASSKKVSTGYDKSWLRDNFYECLAFQVAGDYSTATKVYKALLQIFLKHEWKIDHAIKQRPWEKHEYIHARFHPETFEEFWEDWGNKQNDAVGAILFGVGEIYHAGYFEELGEREHVLRILNKLVLYLQSIEYYHDLDSGMWEEDEEVHASSIGACVAGLKNISKVPGIEVSENLIKKGEEALNVLLPRESKKKFCDLSQLSLIYPYGVTNKKQTQEILKNVEYTLLKDRGVIRYKNDYYYNNNVDGYSEEAEWTFGLAWLSIIYNRLGDYQKAKELLDTMIGLDTKLGLPELYFSNSDKYNENTPLGWTESLFLVALHDLHDSHHSKRKSVFKDVFHK